MTRFEEGVATTDVALEELRRFVADELLDGVAAGLDADTPLLEWGVIDSLSVATLLAFTRERFGVDIPQNEVTPENLKDLGSFVRLVKRMNGSA